MPKEQWTPIYDMGNAQTLFRAGYIEETAVENRRERTPEEKAGRALAQELVRSA